MSFGWHNAGMKTVHFFVQEENVLIWNVLRNFKIQCSLLKVIQLGLQLFKAVSILLRLNLNWFDKPVMYIFPVAFGRMNEFISIF